jgi:hypothetical protein
MSQPVGSIQANLVVDDPNQIVVLQKHGRRYRNFYKIEKWSRDGQRVEEMLFAWNSLANTQRRFSALIEKRPSRG